MPAKTGTVKAKAKKEVEEIVISSSDRDLIRKSLQGYLGSCGCLAFFGLYKIDSVEYARAVLEEAQRKIGLHWNVYVICASSDYQTAAIKTFMKKAGWEIIKTFPEAHPSTSKPKLMTLWGGLGIKNED